MQTGDYHDDDHEPQDADEIAWRQRSSLSLLGRRTRSLGRGDRPDYLIEQPLEDLVSMCVGELRKSVESRGRGLYERIDDPDTVLLAVAIIRLHDELKELRRRLGKGHAA